MTRLDPSLRLARLVVSKDGRSVYDEQFHAGVNIIRGENGSGKSTIADFIFFALGGERTNWNKHAGLCDFVTAEIYLNGSPVTLQRSVSPERQRPMTIFWGGFDAAMGASLSERQLFPFASRGQKKSFSQVLFGSLGIPEVRGELSSRITFHQLLRLMYADQRSPHTRMFLHEDFDSPLIRDAVGMLLCGVYEDRKYEIELRLRELKSEVQGIAAQLDTISKVLGPEERAPSLEFLREERRQRMREREEGYARLRDANSVGAVRSSTPQSTSVREALVSAQASLSTARNRLSDVELDVEDSHRFIGALEQSISALDESHAAREILGEIAFEMCPACLNPIAQQSNEQTCRLCKSPLGQPGDEPRLLRLRRELETQIEESKRILDRALVERRELESRVPSLGSEVDRLQLQLDDEVGSARSSFEAALVDLHRRVGYLDREIEDLDRRLRLAETIDQLSVEKAEKTRQLSRLQDELQVLESRQHRRFTKAASAIRGWTAHILTSDVPTEAEFQAATEESIDFDFAADRVEVDGRLTYSASSMVVIRNAFHLAMLLASLRVGEFRLPRFALLDSVEDKGMQPVRSQNLQRLMVDLSTNSDVEHQLIFTTSMIAPELEDSGLTIGAHYSEAHKSLAIRS